MTIEEFFAAVAPIHAERKALKGSRAWEVHLNIRPVPAVKGGGWQADADGGCAWGDTIEEAIQAAFDHYARLPSKHCRKHPPFFSSTPRTADQAYEVGYDYRSKDWTPEDDPEPVRHKTGTEFRRYCAEELGV